MSVEEATALLESLSDEARAIIEAAIDLEYSRLSPTDDGIDE